MHPVGYSKRMPEIGNALISCDIDSKKKVKKLRNESQNYIKDFDSSPNNKIKILMTLFLYTFWFPAGFLLAYLSNENSEKLANLNTISTLIGTLFELPLIIIGSILMIINLIAFIFQLNRKDHINVLNCLNDVLYHNPSKPEDRMLKIETSGTEN
jgi:hypothetical protein